MGCLYAADPAIEGEMGSRQPSCHVAIIGAGPYGLAAAADLRAAGVEPRAFGVPMEFWERRMPRGMFLRSGPSASEIGDPGNRLTLENYHAVQGTRRAKPVPIADFIGYGQWYQRQVVPDLDRRRVERVERDPKGFRLWLDDGEQLTAGRVVVGGGPGAPARTPLARGGRERLRPVRRAAGYCLGWRAERARIRGAAPRGRRGGRGHRPLPRDPLAQDPQQAGPGVGDRQPRGGGPETPPAARPATVRHHGPAPGQLAPRLAAGISPGARAPAAPAHRRRRPSRGLELAGATPRRGSDHDGTL